MNYFSVYAEILAMAAAGRGMPPKLYSAPHFAVLDNFSRNHKEIVVSDGPRNNSGRGGGDFCEKWPNVVEKSELVKISTSFVEKLHLGRSVKIFGRPGQFRLVMSGKKSRRSKILATGGDFMKFYLAPPQKNMCCPSNAPPPKKIPRPGAATEF